MSRPRVKAWSGTVWLGTGRRDGYNASRRKKRMSRPYDWAIGTVLAVGLAGVTGFIGYLGFEFLGAAIIDPKVRPVNMDGCTVRGIEHGQNRS
jgi:hypothetical protein